MFVLVRSLCPTVAEQDRMRDTGQQSGGPGSLQMMVRMLMTGGNSAGLGVH